MNSFKDKSKNGNVNEKINQIISSPNFENIKSKYIVGIIFNILSRRRSLEIIRHNKNIQKLLDISKKDYEEYSQIEIEVKPINNYYNENEDKFTFIKIPNKEDEYLYHIYFDNSEIEIKRNYLTKEDRVIKIKIVIDYQVKSFYGLFRNCKYVESIDFKRFNRGNIINMSYMFSGCESLKVLNLSNFKTNNVTNMDSIFWDCSSLKEINLSKFITDKVTSIRGIFENCGDLKRIDLSTFKTNNVIDMSNAFLGCSSLTELNLSNFNTDNVTDMMSMFKYCLSIKELNLSSFNTNKVTNMKYMFSKCESLKDLNISNFNTNNVINMGSMFSFCTSLFKLNLSNFKTDNVINMNEMFKGSSSLKELDISNFNVDKASVEEIFSCTSKELDNNIKGNKKMLEKLFQDF